MAIASLNEKHPFVQSSRGFRAIYRDITPNITDASRAIYRDITPNITDARLPNLAVF